MLCPCCERSGRISYIRTLQVGFDEALQLCEQKDCTYPEVGDEVPLLIRRSVKDSIAADIANLAKLVDLEKHAATRLNSQPAPAVAKRSTTLHDVQAKETNNSKKKSEVRQLPARQADTVAKSSKRDCYTSNLKGSGNTSNSKRNSNTSNSERNSRTSKKSPSKAQKRSSESAATSSNVKANDVKLSDLFGDLEDDEIQSNHSVSNSIIKSTTTNGFSNGKAPVESTYTDLEPKRSRVETNGVLFSKPSTFNPDSVHPQFMNQRNSCWFDAALSFFVHLDVDSGDSDLVSSDVAASPSLTELRNGYAAARTALRAELSRAVDQPDCSNSGESVIVNINANARVSLRRDTFECLCGQLANLRETTLQRFFETERRDKAEHGLFEAFDWLVRTAYPDTAQSPFNIRFERRAHCTACEFNTQSTERETSLLTVSNFGVKTGERCTFPHNIFSLTRCNECHASGTTLRCETKFLSLGRFLSVHFEQPGVTIGSSAPTSFADAFTFEWPVESQRFRYRLVAVVQLRPNPNHFICWIRDRLKDTWMECDDLKGLCTSFNRLRPACPPGHVCMLVWQRDDQPLPPSSCYPSVPRPALVPIDRVDGCATGHMPNSNDKQVEMAQRSNNDLGSNPRSPMLNSSQPCEVLFNADDFLVASGPSASNLNVPPEATSQPKVPDVNDKTQRKPNTFTWLRDSPLLAAAARNRPYSSCIDPKKSIRSTDVSPATSSSSVGSQFGSTSSGYASASGSFVSHAQQNARAPTDNGKDLKVDKVNLVCDLLKQRGVQVRFESSSRAFPGYKPTAAAQQRVASSPSKTVQPTNCVTVNEQVQASAAANDATAVTTYNPSNNNNETGSAVAHGFNPSDCAPTPNIVDNNDYLSQFLDSDQMCNDEDLFKLLDF